MKKDLREEARKVMGINEVKGNPKSLTKDFNDLFHLMKKMPDDMPTTLNTLSSNKPKIAAELDGAIRTVNEMVGRILKGKI